MGKGKGGEGVAEGDVGGAGAPSFEGLLAELEAIVGRMERGEQDLEAALADFEKGMGLAKAAGDVLDKAEARLAVLTADGEEAPFGAGEAGHG